MATIKDVAKEAGVSVATVSRVINRNGYVQEETRKLVEAAISKLNYLPNEVARSLYFQKSKLIGLIIPDITNPFFPEIARGVEDVLQQNGYRLIIGNSDEDAEKEVRYIETFTQHNVLGVISTSSEEVSQWEKLNIPVVLLDRIHHDFPFVCSDQRKEGGWLRKSCWTGAAAISRCFGARNMCGPRMKDFCGAGSSREIPSAVSGVKHFFFF